MPGEAAAPPPKGRIVAGVGVFALSWIVTLAIVPIITASSLSTSAAATVSGIVVFVGPKLGVLAAIAILGKPGFTYLKRKAFGYLKPPAEVSPVRYRIGIVMFVAAMLFGLLERYLGFFIPGEVAREIRYSLAIDLLLLASILVLGGDFWDKIRALFIREAKARFPGDA
ncbi:MAG TPA: hypothetical protein VH436_01695 [Vicinamibacterales bacterium]|jgi:hypothetical protein